MEKLCQLAAILSVAWVMVMVVPDWVMVPCPATICPPVGRLAAKLGAGGTAMSPAATMAATMPLDARLPRARANSATAIKALWVSLQMRR